MSPARDAGEEAKSRSGPRTCSQRLALRPRSAPGGRCRSRSPVWAVPRRGPARPCPNMRRGSRPPPFHTMPGGCGGRARRGAVGAAAPRASFLQPPEPRATPPWRLPRAAAGAGGPGAGGGRRGAARPGLAGLRCRVAERRPPGRGSEGRASVASLTRGATKGAEIAVLFQVLVFLPCLA